MLKRLLQYDMNMHLKKGEQGEPLVDILAGSGMDRTPIIRRDLQGGLQ